MPDPEETDGVVTLRERVRERLLALTSFHISGKFIDGEAELVDAIMREFSLRPVSQGKVDAETGEVESR
jgi:hypothetical protein